MKSGKVTRFSDVQEIAIYLDPLFEKEQEKIAYLYVKLLNKHCRFIESLDEADIAITFAEISTTSFVITEMKAVVINAANSLSAFRGAMYLAKKIRTGDEIEFGTIHEVIAERIVMIDIGRKYFSPIGLHQILEEMAFNGCNFLQLHFSEDTGFRIESSRHPELVSEKFLTKKEVTELIRYAAYLHIEIIPDIDTPGHMTHVLKDFPQWQLTKEHSLLQLQKVPSALDITNEHAVTFALSLYQEFIDLFVASRYFHIGADEFVDFNQFEQYPTLRNDGIRKFEAYVNTVATFVSRHGFIPRVWNDAFLRSGKNTTLTKDIEITYWTKWQEEMAPVQRFLDEGYSVVNVNDNYLYYVLGENAGYIYPTAEKIKKEWQPALFASKQRISIDQFDQVKGISLAVWCDLPEAKDEKAIIEELKELMEGFSFHFYDVV